MSDDFKRRDLLRITAGGLLLAKTGIAGTPSFFTKDEYTAVDELMETLIPADGTLTRREGGGMRSLLG